MTKLIVALSDFANAPKYNNENQLGACEGNLTLRTCLPTRLHVLNKAANINFKLGIPKLRGTLFLHSPPFPRHFLLMLTHENDKLGIMRVSVYQFKRH
jgi:hypothetical protein